nr:uncharacterized protein LOC113717096 [Coffea arabica]
MVSLKKRYMLSNLQHGFLRYPYEHTLYIKFNPKGDVLIVGLYVDDLIFTGNSLKLISEFREAMISQFKMTDLGLMSYFIGIEVRQLAGGIFISQKKLASDILNKFKMNVTKPMMTPVEEKLKLTKDGTGDFVDATYFKRLVGTFRYLTSTKPDITYGIGLISRFMESPCQSHLQAAKRILRYVQGTQSNSIFYSSSQGSNLVGYTDSDWAGDTIRRRSTSRYVFYLGFGVFSWSSKKQQVVALSTAEAKYMAATIFHGRSKHIDIKYHFIRELVQEQEIVIDYCRSEDQVANILTKPLKLEMFMKLKKMLGMVKFEDLDLREAM